MTLGISGHPARQIYISSARLASDQGPGFVHYLLTSTCAETYRRCTPSDGSAAPITTKIRTETHETRADVSGDHAASKAMPKANQSPALWNMGQKGINDGNDIPATRRRVLPLP